MTLCGSDLGFSYNGISVLRNVSLRLETGKLVMLVGPNGSGKSTLLKLLCGYLVPDSGSVWLDGRELNTYSGRERAVKQSCLSQDCFPGLEFSVREAVMLGRNPHLGAFSVPGLRDLEAVELAMRDMELLKIADRPVSCLSGGERQRTMLAAVLAQRAECMLLDEPTSALDVRHAVELVQYLRDLSAKCGILMVTHDLGLALRYADEVLLLKDGSSVSLGEPETVLTPENLFYAYGCHAEILTGEYLRAVGFYPAGATRPAGNGGSG